MKDTRATIILATVFHKHKYVTTPGITPEERFIAAAGQLADDLKGCMAHDLSKMTLEQLEQIRTILRQDWMHKERKHPPENPPSPHPIQNRKVHVVRPHKFRVGLPVPRKVSSPHLLFQPPKPASLKTPVISTAVTPPRVMLTPRVEPPRVVPPPMMVPPPRVAHPVNPRQSSRLAA